VTVYPNQFLPAGFLVIGNLDNPSAVKNYGAGAQFLYQRKT